MLTQLHFNSVGSKCFWEANYHFRHDPFFFFFFYIQNLLHDCVMKFLSMDQVNKEVDGVMIFLLCTLLFGMDIIFFHIDVKLRVLPAGLVERNILYDQANYISQKLWDGQVCAIVVHTSNEWEFTIVVVFTETYFIIILIGTQAT